MLIAQEARGLIGMRIGADGMETRSTDDAGGLYIYFPYDNGSNGGGFTGRWHIDDEDFTNMAPDPGAVLRPGRLDPNPYSTFDRTYAAGGSVIECPDDPSKLLYFYHGENQIDPSGFDHIVDGRGWGGIGVAHWSEAEKRFIKDDQIYGMNNSNAWSGTGPAATNQQHPGAAGEASVLYNPVDGYFYLYTTDLTDNPEYAVCTACGFVVVARALASTVCDNVGTPTRTTWKLYYHGDFTEDAVREDGTGGLFTPLLARGPLGSEYPNEVSAFRTDEGVWVLVGSIPGPPTYSNAGGFHAWTSEDGVHWAGPHEILPPATPGKMATPGVTPVPEYASMHDDGTNIRMTFTRKNAGGNWDWAELHEMGLEILTTLGPPATGTATRSATSTRSATPTATPTEENTPLPPTTTSTATAPSTQTPTLTATPSATRTATPTSTLPATQTATLTATTTVTRTSTATSTLPATQTATPTATSTATRTATLTSTPTAATHTATPSSTPTATPTAATETPTFTATPEQALNRIAPTTVPTTAALPTCDNGPLLGCRGPAILPAGVLDLTDRSADEDDRLEWRWTRGSEMSREELGDAIGGETSFQLCLFDANGNTIASASAPPGGDCGGRPCWRETTSQLVYQSRDLPGGHSSMELKIRPGTDGRARINVRARGSFLGLEPLPAAQPMIAQLETSDGECWEAIYDGPAAMNQAGRFRYRAE